MPNSWFYDRHLLTKVTFRIHLERCRWLEPQKYQGFWIYCPWTKTTNAKKQPSSNQQKKSLLHLFTSVYHISHKHQLSEISFWISWWSGTTKIRTPKPLPTQSSVHRRSTPSPKLGIKNLQIQLISSYLQKSWKEKTKIVSYIHIYVYILDDIHPSSLRYS